MQESLVASLCLQRPELHARWEALLRTERVTSPLAYPDSMVHLIDWAMDQLFATLREQGGRRRAEHVGGRAVPRPDCPCGKNPLLAFFRAGEQAMLEALVLEQSAHRPIEPRERDLAFNELCHAIRTMERREVEAFCSVCQNRVASQSSRRRPGESLADWSLPATSGLAPVHPAASLPVAGLPARAHPVTAGAAAGHHHAAH